ncbi:LysR family transcriptional regulator [Siccirubricoccus sp. KC 17139]|uniref:LysR family transcriptional regulator n=1 Tax=Siccirubricoccus soli TaxID=2899147 RepID=A0ABT1D987_9PROT|nr:LysR family transcriptional regulator [Siccirubricoccus soli]MCO6418505.1 LysR family transcriptional regulator [Siccirubricoccus soli]MCP2684640.1 LysR family transcriptional regulator [Siccirubricoccus soli]
MARPETNRAAEMEVFVRVVQSGGFSAAARTLGLSPSAVSKLMARLEARLGARLLSRSTRRLQLTPEGLTFHDRALRILADIAAAEREAGAGAAPRGRLRVNSSVPFGMHRLLPLLPGFLARYPEVQVDVALTDRVVDLLEERADVAIRVGPLRESRLVARKLGETRMVVVAAPAYLDRHGTPRRPEELARHNRIGFCFTRTVSGWPFGKPGGGTLLLPPEGNALVSDGEQLRLLALAGLGLGRLAAYHVAPDIAAGRLVPVLEEWNPGDKEVVSAVFIGPGGALPARVRAFLDDLAETVRL